MAKVVSVNFSPIHSFSKDPVESIVLLEGLGVEGDSHSGEKVQHLFVVKKHPEQANLRQVHLIHSELFEELRDGGFKLATKPGAMGENITTVGVELLNLPVNTILHIGEAIIQITGLRNPCAQMNRFEYGLMAACIDHDSEGKMIRKAGIMSIVLKGGRVNRGDSISIDFPPEPHFPLQPV